MTESDDKLVPKTWRLPKDLIEKLEKASEQKENREKFPSDQALVAHLLSLALDGRFSERDPKLIYKQLIYTGHCKKCKKTVEAGEWAFWGGPGTGLIICMDCEAKKFGTRAQAQRAFMIAQMDYTKNALRKEIAGLIETYGKYNAYEILDSLYHAVIQHYSKLPNLEALANDFMKNGVTSEEAKSIMERWLKAIEESEASDKQVLNTIAEIRDFLTHPFRKKRSQLEVEAKETYG